MKSKVESRIINHKRIHSFHSKSHFLDFIRDKKNILVALNAEKLNKTNTLLDQIINDNIGYPDGIGAVLALSRKGVKSVKIAGAEFWLDIIKEFSESKTFYLIGSSPGVIKQTVNGLRNDFPSINVLGYRDGYFKEGDKEIVIEILKVKRPDIVYVAMGSPKQEYLMAELLKNHPALYMGLGGSFDVYSGEKKRAPKIFINLGLEWFYRLLKEPARIRRQLSLIEFFFKVIFGRI